nr:hypothetical protein [Tanacetum cinerariifolium]
MLKKNFNDLSEMLYQALKEIIPSMVNKEVNKIAKSTVPIYKISEHGTYSDGESLSGEAMDQDQHPSGLGTQEQLEEFDTWLDGFRTDDDEVPNDKVSQELLEAMSGEINEAKLQKVVDEMLRQRCKSVEEHQYHVDQMQNYLKRLKKYTLSLHKFPVVPFPDDDMEGRTLRWVDKPLKKLNVYARYSVEHWKNMWAKQDHIKRQKQLRDNPHEVYSESKIAKIIRITYELGHDHKFITKIIVRRTNRKIDPITESYHKYLNKNDIEDMYLLCINGKVKDYRESGLLGSLVVFIRATVIWERVHDFQLGMESYQQKINLTAQTIIFLGIKEYRLFNIVSKLVCGML